MTAATRTRITASTNPFASRYIDTLPFLMADMGMDRLSSRLGAMGGHAAIVGPHGSGKTTLLERLGHTLARDGWVVHSFRTTERRRGVRDITSRSYGPQDAVLIDSAGHINPILRRRLFSHVRDAGRFVVTEHRIGRLPCLHRCETSLTLLDALVEELAPAIACDVRPHAHTLYARHRGNIRDVLRGLYDHCATLR